MKSSVKGDLLADDVPGSLSEWIARWRLAGDSDEGRLVLRTTATWFLMSAFSRMVISAPVAPGVAADAVAFLFNICVSDGLRHKIDGYHSGE
jgi:hypothetical protein